MDGLKWYHAPLLIVAGIANFFRPTPKPTREEIAAMVDRWQADWIAGNKDEAIDDIMWRLDRSR